MQHAVVEGEPGIFPAPVARVLRAIGGLFDRGRGREQRDQSTPPAPPTDETESAGPAASEKPTDAPEAPPATRSDEPNAE